MPVDIEEENPHDASDEPLLHEAWEKGAKKARDEQDIGSPERHYNEPDAILAYVQGYLEIAGA